MLDKQVSKLEANECFMDPDFSRNAKCLIDSLDEVDQNSFWQTDPNVIEWIRAKDIPCLNAFELFSKDGIKPADIVQGTLGDCYFLTVVSMVAEFPDVIKSLFSESKECDGKYLVNLFKNG